MTKIAVSTNSVAPDKAVVPPGPYCYAPTGRTREVGIEGITTRVPETKPCPYWSMSVIDEEPCGACALLGIDDRHDSAGMLFDQIKLCGINDDEEKP